MYARSTTFQGRPETIDAGVAFVRDEVLPLIQTVGGCSGLSLMVDRRSGRCIATSAWQSAETMRAGDAQLKPLRARGAEILGGSPEVEEWEIALLHRDHRSRDGACVRATWVKCDPARIDRAIDTYKTVSLPAMEGLSGFCSASLFVNRGTGRAVSSVTYDSLNALEHSREEAGRIRSQGIKEAKADVLDVEEFELVLAHLRVPELV